MIFVKIQIKLLRCRYPRVDSFINKQIIDQEAYDYIEEVERTEYVDVPFHVQRQIPRIVLDKVPYQITHKAPVYRTIRTPRTETLERPVTTVHDVTRDGFFEQVFSNAVYH